MKFLILLFSFLFFFIFTTILSAQNNGSIKGVLVDENNNPIKESLVTLLKENGTIEKTTFSSENGSFEFSYLSNTSFFIVITNAGYQDFKSENYIVTNENFEIKVPTIILKKLDSNKLNEVNVTSKAPFVIQKVDRTIVNPEALISNTGGNALEALAKSPGVMVGENGEIKLKGKSGVTIFIDDKPTYLTGSELENYLKSLPTSSVKQFEIMTNPPAHYEAAGNSGIINIKTKRSALKGLNGTVSASYGQGKYARTNENLNINFNTSKVAIFSNLSYSNANGYHDLTINRYFKNPDLSPKSGFEQNTYLKVNSNAYNLRLGADFYISEKSTIGILTKGMLNKQKHPRYNYAKVTNADENIDKIVIADNIENVDFKNSAITLNFRQLFSIPEQQFTTDFDYVNYLVTNDQIYKNDVFSNTDVNLYSDLQNGYLPSTIKIYALKSDYTTPLKNNSKLDLGFKTSFTKTDNNAIYTITTNGTTSDNNDLSNHFLYDEMINAVYVNYTKTYKKFDFQAGLRFEDTQLTGKQLGNPIKPYSEFKNNYNSLFPTLYVGYKIDSLGTKSINLSYGKRVNRPFYKDLNPFSSPLDQYTFYEGNPYLKPTFAHNFSLSHSYKELLTTTLSYSYTKDDIKETIEINNGFYYSRPKNIGESKSYVISFQSKFNLLKWLTTTMYSEINYAEYKSQLYTRPLNSSGTYWFINCNNSFEISKKWSAEISGEYITNSVDAQFTIGDFGHATIGAQKKIFNNSGTLKFKLTDVFFTNRIRGTINNLELTNANWYGPRDTRIATISLSYRFGKNTNNKTRYNGTGSESEQNRVKT